MLQNGLTGWDRARCASSASISGASYIGAWVSRDGDVVCTRVGPPCCRTKATRAPGARRAIRALFARARLPLETAGSERDVVWRKVAVTAMTWSCGALALPVDLVRASDRLGERGLPLLREVAEVARAEGATVDPAEVVSASARSRAPGSKAPRTRRSRTASGSRFEVCESIPRRAAAAGLEAPLTRLVASLARIQDQSFAQLPRVTHLATTILRTPPSRTRAPRTLPVPWGSPVLDRQLAWTPPAACRMRSRSPQRPGHDGLRPDRPKPRRFVLTPHNRSTFSRSSAAWRTALSLNRYSLVPGGCRCLAATATRWSGTAPRESCCGHDGGMNLAGSQSASPSSRAASPSPAVGDTAAVRRTSRGGRPAWGTPERMSKVAATSDADGAAAERHTAGPRGQRARRPDPRALAARRPSHELRQAAPAGAEDLWTSTMSLGTSRA